MPNFSFSTASNFLRFTPECLDEIRNRIAEKKAQRAKTLKEGGSKKQEEVLQPQLDLKVFKKLPLLYGKPPPWLIGEPLEDLDPYYKDQETFMVLSSRNRIFRFSATKALFLFSPFHPLRRLAVKIVIHTLFIAFITCVVLINCIFMTLNEPPKYYETIEIVFAVIYTLEFLVKVVARGFVCNKFTYLRDPWNILDLFVLIMTYVALSKDFGSISAIRIFRILRTLKAVSVIPGLKVIIASLLQSVRKLAHVMLLTVFFLSIFALVGLQIFKGILKRKCISNETLSRTNSNTDNNTCYKWKNTDFQNEPNCTNKDNPDYGYTSFDHFGWAFLSVFRLMTLDSWERLYREVIFHSGKGAVIFFVIVIFLCSFYLFNLILAVVTMSYEEQMKASQAHIKAKEMLFREAKELLQKEKEQAAGRVIASEENTEMQEFENNKGKREREKEQKGKRSPGFGENETMFYSPPDKSQTQLKEMLMSYHLPSEAFVDQFQRQRLTTAANVISKTMEWEESKFEFIPGLKHALKPYLVWQCCPLWIQIKKRVKTVMINPYTELFITLCIIVNTFLMAFQNILFDKEIIPKANIVFTAIFTIEMIMKVISLDPYYYFQEAWNIFDFVVVILGIMNLISSVGISTIRVMRIFKLSKFWPALNKLMKIMLKSVGPLSNLTLVLICTIFIFAVVGKQGLGGLYKNSASTCAVCDNDKVQSCSMNETYSCILRWHMKDFLHSFLIIFRILCGEWIETMWVCMEVASKEGCITLFMLVLVFGNLVVLNLFIALLLSSFSRSDPDTEAVEKKHQLIVSSLRKSLRFLKHLLWDRCCSVLVQKIKQAGLRSSGTTAAIQKDGGKEALPGIWSGARNQERKSEDERVGNFMIDSQPFVCVPLAEMEHFSDDEEEEGSIVEMDCEKQENQLRKRREIFKRSRERLSSQASECPSAWSLDVPRRSNYDTSPSEASTIHSILVTLPLVTTKEPKACFPPGFTKLIPFCTLNTDKFPGNTWWKFRKTCYKIVKHSWFESFIIFIILLSSGALVFEDYHLEEQKHIKAILEYADILFFYIFSLEMLLKWVAYGFMKYFTSAWCFLDFFIVCVSFPLEVVNVKRDLCDSSISTKSLRTLRALRPLRAMSRFKGIKVVVNALAGAIPSIGNVLLVCVVFWLPFNILGIQLFGGRFYSCKNNTSVLNVLKNECESQNFNWTNNLINFDNVGQGYLALLQVATFKGWTDIMYAAVDASTGENITPPCFEQNVYAYIYFVFFIIFGSFFMLNLFIGVVIDNFNRQRKKISGEMIFLSEDQKKYYNALKKLGTKKPHRPVPRPQNKLQGFLFDIVTNKAFDIFILSLIFLNVIVMAAEYEGQSKEAEEILDTINFIFVGIFTMECFLKLLALRLFFFKDPWNIFDFVIVILSILSSSDAKLKDYTNISPTFLRVIRIIRISRLLRLIKGAKGLQTLLFALLMSLPALLNIGLLLFLIMFIYAIFGMSNFACAPHTGGIDRIFNFQTFGGSMLCLFQMTTSAGWNDLLNPMLDEKADSFCPFNAKEKTPMGRCINSGVAIAYFVSYVIISFLIVINMYIAVIIENLNTATEESTEPLGEDDFEIFYEVWAKFDPKATQFISYSALSDFADALAEPLRIPKPNKQHLLAMDLPMVSGNKIHCLDILFAFTKRVLGEYGEMDAYETQIEQRYPERIAYEPIITTPKRKQVESAIVIQRAFRAHLRIRAKKKISQGSCASCRLESISEATGVLEFSLNISGDIQSNNSQSPSSVSIPPSYSKITGLGNSNPQVIITDSENDTN